MTGEALLLEERPHASGKKLLVGRGVHPGEKERRGDYEKSGKAKYREHWTTKLTRIGGQSIKPN